MKLFISALCILSVYTAKSDHTTGSSVVTVGGDSACDFSVGSNRIQDAIFSGADEIRIASNTAYVENLWIENISLSLTGGFVDCNAANNNTQSDVLAEISGNVKRSAPVIYIAGNVQRYNVRFENLHLKNGSGTSGFSTGGGISTFLSDSSIRINNLLISENQSLTGGGILVNASEVNMIIRNTQIENNTASNGGGIACLGAQSRITIQDDSQIINNQAMTDMFGGGNGGGVYLNQNCKFNAFATILKPDSFNPTVKQLGSINNTSIIGNYAESNGGGIYASGGSEVLLQSYIDTAVYLQANTSDSDGGGMYLTGLGTQADIVGGNFINNNSGGNGGALSVNDVASFSMSKTIVGGFINGFGGLPTFQCLNDIRCNLFAGNLSQSAGGAIHNEGSSVYVTAAYFENNRAQTATAVTTGDASSTVIENSLFTGNGNSGEDGFDDLNLMNVSGFMVNFHNTIADNDIQGAHLYVSPDTNDGVLNFLTIIHNQNKNGVIIDAPPNASYFDCAMVHEIDSILNTDFNRVLVEDPGFVDRANGDYHLSAQSPAIDFCNKASPPAQSLFDLDNNPRPFDDPATVDKYGIFDLGADEYIFIDLIFKNGFEPVN